MILCLCQRGNVRSATAATVLRDCFGEMDVLATGLQTTTPETLYDLACEADQIYIVGDDALAKQFADTYPMLEYKHLNVGIDRWMTPMHPDLVTTLVAAFQANGYSKELPFYGTTDNYLNAVQAVWNARVTVN